MRKILAGLALVSWMLTLCGCGTAPTPTVGVGVAFLPPDGYVYLHYHPAPRADVPGGRAAPGG
ncbi:MAG: hypothetical protein V8R55_04290 [Dysosmobacter sp.]